MRSPKPNFGAHFEALKCGRKPITLSGMDPINLWFDDIKHAGRLSRPALMCGRDERRGNLLWDIGNQNSKPVFNLAVDNSGSFVCGNVPKCKRAQRAPACGSAEVRFGQDDRSFFEMNIGDRPLVYSGLYGRVRVTPRPVVRTRSLSRVPAGGNEV